ncbi:MAG TPA: hypothetical protein VHD33_01760 [Legionellaceae bacterium]|nr:hypothetical protein [Legionellaceae bacterium]
MTKTLPSDVGQELEFITQTFKHIKSIEQSKYKKAQALRKLMFEKIEMGEQIDNYRIQFLRESVDKLFTFMDKIGQEFNTAHPDDKFTTNDIGDILATAIETLNGSLQTSS